MRKLLRQLLLVCMVALYCHDVSAQEKKVITGTVVDSDGVPVVMATVKEKGASNGVVADEKGRFQITVAADATLVFSSIGLTTTEVKISKSNVLSVEMKSSSNELSSVVVTALGVKRDKKSLGYAVQQIKGEDVIKAAPADLAQGLAGKIAGLNVSTGNGLGNASSRIVIRGNNSIKGNNQPLIVIDGAILENNPIEQSTTNGTDGIRDWGNYLSYMNMENVESISVLKGPGAAALYGARGANGVILVTSKKGVAQKGIGVEYNSITNFTDVYRFTDVQNEYGGGLAAALWTANPKLPRTSTGEQYLPTLYGGSQYGAGGTGIGYYHGSIPGGFQTWDHFSWFGAGASWGPKLDGSPVKWWDGQTRSYSPQPDNREAYYKTGTETTHNVSFSAANDFGSVRLSINNKKGDAVVDNTNYKTSNYALGANVKISKVLSAEVNASYNENYRLNAPEIGTNNSWSKFSVYGMSREYRPLEQDVYKNKDGSKYAFPSSYPYAEYGQDLYWYFNEKNSHLDRDEFISTIKLNAEITPWLRAFVRTSANLIATEFITQSNTTSSDGLSGGGFYKSVGKDNLYNTDFMVELHKENLFTPGLTASLSGMYNDYSSKKTSVNGTNNSKFIVPGVYSLLNFTDRNQVTLGETRYDVQSYSGVGILDLNYKDYLFLQVTGRKDVNSTLPKDSNSTFYPSVNTSFVFTDAFDMSKVENVLSYGKVRFIYGEAANATDPYQLDATYNTGTFGGQPTNSLPSTVPPLTLGFQTSKTVEFGTALGFFKDKLNIDFSYYDIYSDNQIMNSSISTASGASEVKFNTGALRNRGFDFTINATAVQTNDFSWNIAFNGAKNTNRVEELGPGVKEEEIGSVFGNLGAFMKVSPGENYGTIYGTDFELDAQGRKQVINLVDGTGKVVGTKYKITSTPVAIGNAAPKMTGGLSNTFRYKNLSLNLLVDFKYGGDIYSVDHATSMGNGLSPATLVERNGGGLPYTYPDGTTANTGIIMEGFNISDNRPNDRVVSYIYKYAAQYAGWSDINLPRSLSVFENSWVKMREVVLTYRFNPSLLHKSRIFQDLSISAIGRNLFYFYTTLPDHLNPEAVNGTGNGQGLQWSAFPSTRTVGISLKAKF